MNPPKLSEAEKDKAERVRMVYDFFRKGCAPGTLYEALPPEVTATLTVAYFAGEKNG